MGLSIFWLQSRLVYHATEISHSEYEFLLETAIYRYGLPLGPLILLGNGLIMGAVMGFNVETRKKNYLLPTAKMLFKIDSFCFNCYEFGLGVMEARNFINGMK